MEATISHKEARQELSSIFSAVITGIVTFAATNVDDLFILMFFFSQTDAAFRRRHIVAGQYLGFAVLVAISLLGFFGSFILPTAWIGLLGLFPIIMGKRPTKPIQAVGKINPPRKPRRLIATRTAKPRIGRPRCAAAEKQRRSAEHQDEEIVHIG